MRFDQSLGKGVESIGGFSESSQESSTDSLQKNLWNGVTNLTFGALMSRPETIKEEGDEDEEEEEAFLAGGFNSEGIDAGNSVNQQPKSFMMPNFKRLSAMKNFKSMKNFKIVKKTGSKGIKTIQRLGNGGLFGDDGDSTSGNGNGPALDGGFQNGTKMPLDPLPVPEQQQDDDDRDRRKRLSTINKTIGGGKNMLSKLKSSAAKINATRSRRLMLDDDDDKN